MSSVIEICNTALSLIGQGSINSLDENSPEAIQCKLKYDNAKEELLREFAWSFCSGPLALALTTVNFPGWNYVYMYPSNIAALRRIFSADNPLDLNNKIQYVTYGDGQNKYIACNIPNAWADVTYKAIDPNLYDSQFKSALSYKLAIQMVPLTGQDSKKNGLYQEYQMILRSAQLTSATENNFNPSLPTSYVDCRR